MKNYYRKIQALFTYSIILRNICMILLLGIIIIGIRAWSGDFVLDNIRISERIMHYFYFYSVLGYLCINIRIAYLYIMGENQDKGNGEQLTTEQISKNIVILIVCIVVCGITMWHEGAGRVVSWIDLQNGLIAWSLIIYAGEAIAGHIHFDYKNKLSSEDKIRQDSFYIPKLLEKIEDEQLKDYIAHELYTYAVRARFYKYGYYICSITALVAPTIVVIINSRFSESDSGKLSVSIFSGIATIASGMLGIVKFKETWTRYRYNCEILKSEIAAYINNKGDYEDAWEKEELFYERINSIINGEISDWRKLRQENNS